MNIKVSVIVPVYNVEEYIKRAIDSLIDQSLNEIEIVLVDDGSPDNCGKIIDEYASKYNNIVPVHKENGGPSDARNAGMAAATGEYIGFLDPDDYAEPEMFEKLYISAKENNSDIVFCGYKEHFTASYIEKHNVNALKSLKSFSDIANEAVSGDLGSYAWSKLYKACVIRDNGISFAKGVSVTEDTIFLFEFLRFAESFSVADGYLYNYIRQPKSICASYQKGRFEYYKLSADAIEKTLRFFGDTTLDEQLKKNEILLLEHLLDTIDVQSSPKNKASISKRYNELCKFMADERLLALIKAYGTEFEQKHRKAQIKNIIKGKKKALFINEFFTMRIVARIKYYLNIGG